MIIYIPLASLEAVDMQYELLVAIAVILPLLAGLVCLMLGTGKMRGWIVSSTAVALGASSLLLLYGGDFSFTPTDLFEKAVLALDFSLLGYFLYIGIKRRNHMVTILTLLQLLPAAYLEFVVGGGHVDPIIVVDRLSILLGLIINIVGPVVCIYALSYMDEHEDHLNASVSRQPRFFFFMLLLLGAMNGLIFSNSLYWLYFFWEVTTLCCYELIRHDGTEIAEENAQRALWMSLVGGVALIAAIYAGHFTVGSTALDVLLGAKPTPILLIGFAFMALAAFTKSAQFPFQSWLLGAMVAPTPVSALLHSSTMVNAGIYMILRISPAIKGTPLSWVIALIGAFTFMLTAVLAVNQRVSKGILAYSTIGNLGLIILCAGINTPLSHAAALTLLLFHSLSKGLLFMGAGIVENRIHSRLIDDWEGLLGRLPFTTIIMVAGMASMFLPPFGMLLGKWVAMDAVASSPQLLGTVLIVLMVVGSAATTLFWAKWLGHLTILPMRKISFTLERLQAPYQFSLSILLGLDVLIGVGAAYLIKNIVLPVTSVGQRPELVTPSLNVNTGVGTFLVLPLWAAFILIPLLGMYVAKRKGGAVRTPYLGGENIGDDPVSFRTIADTEAEFKVAGMFLDDIISEGRMSKYGVMVGFALILLMFVTAVI